ncbi:hypothetical protein GOODEAATRI_009500, partial [Goodea atripinnis]
GCASPQEAVRDMDPGTAGTWSDGSPVEAAAAGSSFANFWLDHQKTCNLFKTYAPVAFRYFRELFGIRPDDYLVRSFPSTVIHIL